jgi:hypothetical protein
MPILEAQRTKVPCIRAVACTPAVPFRLVRHRAGDEGGDATIAAAPIGSQS